MTAPEILEKANLLDRIVRPDVRLFGRSWSAFSVCGGIGLFSGISLALMLAARHGLSVGVMAAVSATALIAFLVLMMAGKIVTGEERMIFYRDILVMTFAILLLLRGLHLPVLPYLDVAFIGLSLITAWGRVGCLMVGCCYGRPCRRGVLYDARHIAAGFPAELAHRRLFPVQAVEAGWRFLLTAVGSALLFRSPQPGVVVAAYGMLHPLGRYLLEFARWSPPDTRWAGMSSAQWASLLLACGTVMAEERGWLPASFWHPIVAGSLLAVSGVLWWKTRHRPRTDDLPDSLPRDVRASRPKMEIH